MKRNLCFAAVIVTLVLAKNNAVLAQEEISNIKVGISYSSEALSSGRNFNVPQFALSPSVGYYHKSGIHAIVDGTLLGSSSPSYTLTTISIGYLSTGMSAWGYGFDYSRNIFNPDSAGLIKNVLSASGTFSRGLFSASAQYSYLFENETAHRVLLGINAVLTKDSLGHFVQSINFSPGVFFTLGTSNVPFVAFTKDQFLKGTGYTWKEWKARRQRARSRTATSSQNLQFGLMNIDLTLPFTASFKNFQVGVSYTYAIPEKLSEEVDSDIKPTGYLSLSIAYTF
jgi:hypothetical protein